MAAEHKESGDARRKHDSRRSDDGDESGPVTAAARRGGTGAPVAACVGGCQG
ncbi:hypothetical protein [Streptomyces sp. RB17]|uniref:hypothetical protein n=1 Tax=Streptomyces sp. RB17 TaxID=2585197 RepID=UPI001294F3CB|nr:hypothetical protein [Streptomyces sp. RB17]